MTKQRVAIGFSGGVDSSVTAHLLKERGYDVVGVLFENYGPHRDRETAHNAAKKIGIQFEVIDLRKEFKEKVWDPFLVKIKKGKTPNPCVQCNQFFKFGILLDRVTKDFGADFLATGHYACVTAPAKNQTKFQLQIPRDTENDQTYFLHQLSQNQLSRIIFPLADLTKPDVRKIADQLGLPNSQKKSSSDVCFLQKQKFTDFLKQNLPAPKPGNIIEITTGKKIGQHAGLLFYTLGQRKDLGIGGVKNFPEAPWFVVKKNFETNELVVSQDEKFLERSELRATGVNWIAGEPPTQKFECTAKIRYRGQAYPCEVSVGPNETVVKFETPVHAVTPGQSVVFYEGDVCLGGGEIQ